jgi:hypothetical protein
MEGLINCGVLEWFVFGVFIELIFVVHPIHFIIRLELEISYEFRLAIFLSRCFNDFIEWCFDLSWDDLVHLRLTIDQWGHRFMISCFLLLKVTLQFLLVVFGGQEPIIQL